MKKYVLLIAGAVLSWSSCTNEIETTANVETDVTKEITASAYVPGMTRVYNAQEVNLQRLQNEGFYLGALTGTDPYFASGMTYDSKNRYWALDDTVTNKTWPKDVNTALTFYGIYTGYKITEANKPNLRVDEQYGPAWIIHKDTIQGERDLMAAFVEPTTLAEHPSGEVQLDFKHILAEVVVNFKGAIGGYKYLVGQVILSTPAGGTYAFAIDGGMFVPNVDARKSYKLDEAGISSGSFMNPLELSAERFTPCGDTIMVAPGECNLTFSMQTGVQGGELTDIEDKSFSFEVLPGYRNIVNVTVDPASKAFFFNVDVINWDEEENIIELPDPRV